MRPAQAQQIEPSEVELALVRTPFRTHLRLSEKSEEALVEYALQRIGEIQIEVGLDSSGNSVAGSWMELRDINQKTYDGDFSWRAQKLGGVFATKGAETLSLSMSSRFVRELAAKICDDMFGTRPFFAAVKKTEWGGEIAEGVDELIQQKVDGSALESTLREAVLTSLTRNESVVKTRYVRKETKFRGPARVMVDANGEPIRTPYGFLIYENDDLLPDPTQEGVFRLRKDPLFVMESGQYGFQDFPELEQSEITFEGTESKVLDHRSFLCSLQGVDNIHDADLNVHLYDDQRETLEGIYGSFEQYGRYCDSCAATSGEYQPKEAMGERQDGQVSAVLKTVQVAECYVRFDADGDGAAEEIFLVIDRANRKAIFYEYLKVQMPKRPFAVIPGLEKIPNRWYGIGVIQRLAPQNNYVDAQFIRINNRDSRESSFTFFNPNSVTEWSGGMKPVGGTSQVFTLKQGFDKDTNPPLFRINLNEEVSELGFKLMGEMQQELTLQFGAAGNAASSAQGLNISRTATGALSNERSANIITKHTEATMLPGVEDIIYQSVVLNLENLRDQEMFFSRDGKALHTLSREEARGIALEVRLLLTRSRSTESMTINQQAKQTAMEYIQLKRADPESARALRPFFVHQLKNLEVSDPDKTLPEVSDQEIAAWQAAVQKAQNPPEPPKMSISYKDAAPSIRRQMEALEGFEPATPEEHETEQDINEIEATPPPKPAAKAPAK